MRLERMSIADGLRLAGEQPCAHIIALSGVYYGPTPAELDPAEWIEARFFGPAREVRFLPGNDGLQATCLTEEPDDRTVDYRAKVVLPGHAGERLLARKYLETDEDGQSYIAAVRLVAEEEIL